MNDYNLIVILLFSVENVEISKDVISSRLHLKVVGRRHFNYFVCKASNIYGSAVGFVYLFGKYCNFTKNIIYNLLFIKLFYIIQL